MLFNGTTIIDSKGVAGTMPVDTIYLTTNAQFNPIDEFGGDWENIAQNVTLPLGNTAPIFAKTGNNATYYPIKIHRENGVEANLYLRFGQTGDPISIYNSLQSGSVEIYTNLSQTSNSIKVWVWKRIF